MSTVTISPSTTASPPLLRPAATVALFALPALALIAGVHLVMPWFNRTFGLAPFYGYFAGVATPLATMLLASLIGLRAEGRPLTRAALRQRFRLHKLDRRAWVWTLGTLVAAYLLVGLFTALNGLLLSSGLLAAPPWIPAFLAPISAQAAGGDLFAIYAAAFGGLAGNWTALFLYLLLLFFNIVGEEFWWRGYILPRQEAALGGRAWLVHGLLWWAFHAFKWWDLLPLLPVCLLISLLAQRTRNSTPAIIVHAIFNGMALIPLLLAVSGLIA